MKNAISLLFAFICISAEAQNKFDNTIVVDTTRTIKEIKQILFNNGYTIDGIDTTFFMTTPKQIKGASVIRLMIARTDTSITIKGQAKILVELMGIKYDFMPVEYRLSKQNLNYDWFAEMNKIAKLMGGRIRYLKE